MGIRLMRPFPSLLSFFCRFKLRVGVIRGGGWKWRNGYTSKRLTSYSQSSSRQHPVRLEFQDGSTAACDVLVGADGVKSAVRAVLVRELADAARIDQISPDDPYLDAPRGNAEILVAYAPVASGGASYALPFDGKHISSPVILLLPTSRGKVTIASADPLDDPALDPNYVNTETDRAALRAGIRQALRIMETSAAKEFVEGETPPPGFSVLTSASSDEELDARIEFVGNSFYQYCGTAAMGAVVDSQCRVLGGVQGLRVMDASVLPVPLAGHYQAPMYAFAEAAADMLLGK